MSNSASSQVNQADQKPPPPDPTCEDLKKKNTEQRDQVARNLRAREDELNQEERLTLEKAEGTRMTFSSIFSTIPGAGGTMTACSSGCAQACSPNELQVGGTSEMKMGLKKDIRESTDPAYDDAKDKAGVLCDSSYVHPGGGKGAHAEPKLLNQLSNDSPDSPMRGGKILLSIDWRFNKGGKQDSSGMPCQSCYKMLCHAAKKCDIKVFICDKDGNEQPFPEDCENPTSYSDLSTRVDGYPQPGRNPQ
ncbi:hypothetical protein CBA19CS22_34450 [Caballeronia novacaledonica]|uniref:Uncharacterized protein n=1 Tax=Caballeronia novacaledonica TaxID=1544861 RepID=A0ACB5R421_9BURK|nr:hypothetical protein CBA19CS22_34450 [Caballeronia novacaledonica]